MTTKQPQTEKLQKVLARAGKGSRRKMETVIAEGRVRVNGKVARLGERVAPTDEVRLDGHQVAVQSAAAEDCRVIMYYKPEGELVTRHDPEGRSVVYDQWPVIKGGRWVAVGRLDINTSGLLLATSDGELANRLMHPSHAIEREYAVRVFGDVGEADLQALLKGVQLEDGEARFNKIMVGGGDSQNQWFHVVLQEGRNREVRRLWEARNLQVSRLIRTRYGPLELPRKLVPGGWIELSVEQVNELRQLVGLEPTRRAPVLGKADHKRQFKQARRAARRRRQS